MAHAIDFRTSVAFRLVLYQNVDSVKLNEILVISNSYRINRREDIDLMCTKYKSTVA